MLFLICRRVSRIARPAAVLYHTLHLLLLHCNSQPNHCHVGVDPQDVVCLRTRVTLNRYRPPYPATPRLLCLRSSCVHHHRHRAATGTELSCPWGSASAWSSTASSSLATSTRYCTVVLAAKRAFAARLSCTSHVHTKYACIHNSILSILCPPRWYELCAPLRRNPFVWVPRPPDTERRSCATLPPSHAREEHQTTNSIKFSNSIVTDAYPAPLTELEPYDMMHDIYPLVLLVPRRPSASPSLTSTARPGAPPSRSWCPCSPASPSSAFSQETW